MAYVHSRRTVNGIGKATVTYRQGYTEFTYEGALIQIDSTTGEMFGSTEARFTLVGATRTDRKVHDEPHFTVDKHGKHCECKCPDCTAPATEEDGECCTCDECTCCTHDECDD